MTRPRHRNQRPDRRARRRAPDSAPRETIHLTTDGVPAATPDAPPVSPVVFVSDESLAQHPWLPPRVIAGSIWRGPGHERVRVDEHGNAAPWRNGQRPVR